MAYTSEHTGSEIDAGISKTQYLTVTANVDLDTLGLKADKTYVDGELATKVDIVVGKGLSTEDYTTTEKTKLSGIEEGAEVNNISDVNATDLTDGGETTLHIHDGRYYTKDDIDTNIYTKTEIDTNTYTKAQVDSEIDTDVAVVQNDLDAHKIDTSDPHDVQANQVDYDNIASGLTAVDAQSAIDEVDDDLDTHKSNTTTAHGIDSKADKTDVLLLDNTVSFTPTEDYHPSTKKYVDDTVNVITSGTAAPTGGNDGDIYLQYE